MRVLKQIMSVVACSLLSTIPEAARGAESDTQLLYGETGRLDTFDPYTVHEASGQRLADLIFDPLVDVNTAGEYTPALAKSWQIENGGTEVVLNLRENVSWHSPVEKSGVQPPKFGPDDVITTVRLLLSQQSDIPNKERFSALKAVEKSGEMQVRVYLNRALVDPLRVLMFKVLPAHALGATPSLKRTSEFAQAPVGTGPYSFVKANTQGEVLLTANAHYFAGAPKIRNIVMKAYADQSVMAQSLMFNSLDLITYVSPRDLGEILGDAKLNVVPYDALSFSFFAMNTTRGPLRDKRVRQAIAHAINREEMLAAFFQNKGRVISGPFPPTSWAYNLDVKPLAHDINRARSLLSAAGLKESQGFFQTEGGKPINLVFAVPLTGESEMIKRMVLAFQNYLEKVGLKVELQFMDWLVWKKRVLSEHDYDVTIASWSFDDSSNITSLFHSSSAKPWGNNFVLYRNPEVDSLLSEADATNDIDKRRAIYHKLHAVLADEAPYAYLWTLMHHAAHNERLSGVMVEPFNFFKHIVSWDLQSKKTISVSKKGI